MPPEVLLLYRIVLTILGVLLFHMKLSTVLSAVKNNDILNFACKWMEMENTILSEVTQTLKDEYGMYSLISGF